MPRYTPETAHRIMSAVKSSNTSPEIKLRKALWHSGFRYRVNVKEIIGKPDIVFSKARIVVFCDGDFWHGHNWVIRGLSSLDEELEKYDDYWKKKITRNMERDKEVTEKLTSEGWIVLRFWGKEIKKNTVQCADQIEKVVRER